MRYFLIIFILLPVMAAAQLIEIPLPAPGRLGMISALGASEIPLEAMRYSLNVDVFTKPGVLQKRVGLQNYGGTNLHLYGAYGYYNPYDNHKLVVGVHDSTFIWFDTLGETWGATVGCFFVSDTFTTNPDIGVPGLVFPYRNSYHDWLPYRDLLIHCDGKSIPSVFTTSQTFPYQDSAFDTSGYEPRAISMGLEAPGQLRVGITGIAGLLDGIYRYSYAYLNANHDSCSPMAIPSAIVFPQEEQPYLTQFEECGSTPDSVDKLILRQKMDGRDVWYVIDTLQPATLDTTLTVLRFELGFRYVGYVRRAHQNYTYICSLYTDMWTVVSYAVGASAELAIEDLRDALIDSIEAEPLSDSVTLTPLGRQYFFVKTDPPLWDITGTSDTAIDIQTVWDNYSYSSSTTSIIYSDNISDSTILAWQHAAVKCSINTLTGSFDYTVSIGYNDNSDTSTVSYTADGDPTDAEVCAGLVTAINADDSISLRVTAYDSSLFYIIRVDSLDLLLDSLCFDAKHDTVRIQNTRWKPAKIDTTIRTPGGLISDSLTTSGGSQSVTTASGYHAMIDSVYPIKYTYYDPATGFESPPGPTYYTTLSDSSGIEDTAVFRSVSTGWPADGRPKWMRLYQGVMHSDVTGFGDAMYWYGLYQMRTNDSARTIIWGNWTDAAVGVLLDTSEITVDTIYDYQLFVNAAGNSIMRPPYCYDLQIPFSDMEYAHFRFYGIGDPLGPNNIYFTPVDTISWYPLDYFEIEPGVDEFVALEELYGTLYAFKHNSIWFIAGFDAELETPWGKIIDTDVEVRQLTTAYGVVSRETVCKYNDAIYFLTPKGEVMVIDAQGLSELSTPIQNWIDTLFKATSVSGVMQADYVAFDKYAHLFVADEQVKIINDSSGRLMSFHIPTQTWGEQKYTSFIPTRMFKYDSTEGLVGTDVELYFAEGTGKYKQEYPTGHTSDAAGNFEWAAEFSMPGDGMNFFSINQINLRHEPQSLWWLRYSIYDSNGDSLIAGSIYQYGDHYRFIRWDMLPHDLTMYPSIRLWGKSGETTGGGEPQPIPNLFEIESIIFTIRNQGLIYAQ